MFSAVRKLLNLAIVLLIANAAYQFARPYINYVQFRDAVKESAIFSRGVPDAALTDRVLSLAEEHSIPIEREHVSITRIKNHITIDASYVQEIPFLPTWNYPWEFAVRADAVNITPPRASDFDR